MKILNFLGSLAFLVEAKTNFFPSRENIGKLEKKKGQARRENRD
jgi:hypothetical protein